MKVLVTGGAGFIGMHVAIKLLECGNEVIVIDNMNDYYSVELKEARLKQLDKFKNFKFIRGDISDKITVNKLFEAELPTKVVNLAAQASVRYSFINPDAYIKSNLVGFANILEACRNYPVEKLVYASSSSVYGLNEKVPFSELDEVNTPTSLYAATKRSNELLAFTYRHLYGIKAIGLRYFTVYGPWGRPDMAPWLFTKAMIEQKKIKVFNKGEMSRDFTYIDDIVDGTLSVLNADADFEGGQNNFSDQIFNIGGHNPIKLMDFIGALEKKLNIVSLKEYLPMQPGEVISTYADISKISTVYNFIPQISIEQGISKWVDWYKSNNY